MLDARYKDAKMPDARKMLSADTRRGAALGIEQPVHQLVDVVLHGRRSGHPSIHTQAHPADELRLSSDTWWCGGVVVWVVWRRGGAVL